MRNSGVTGTFDASKGDRETVAANSTITCSITTTRSPHRGVVPSPERSIDMAKKKSMSQDHKDALARGRTEGRAIRAYLEAISVERKPGRKADRGTIESRIQRLQEQIDGETNAARRVELIQKRLDNEIRLAGMEDNPDLENLEREFARSVKDYSKRKGISYNAWREAGVPAAVLKQAGLSRGRGAA